MQEKYLKYSQLIQDLKGWVAFNSVQNPAEENAPFGKEVKEALLYGLDLGNKMGFETINYDNYIGEIVWGEGEELGIIGHCDIVPAGEGWLTNPFELVEKEDVLYGRGTTDDKGPTLACLYAMKMLKDEGFTPKRKIRFFIGCNEESGWGDIDHLNKVSHFPKYGFSPDGDFPVVYAEKGPNKVIFTYPLKNSNIKGFTGGTVANAVCAKCSFSAKIDDTLLKKYNLTAENSVITSIGKSAHGSMPEKGKNAMLPAFEYLLETGEDVLPILNYLFYDKFEIARIGNESGHATMSPNLIRQEGDNLVITVDFRVPAMFKLEDFLPYFDKMGIPYAVERGRDPLYVPKDSEFVQTLIGAFNSATGENRVPVSQCGGTFASVFELGCAFGPEFDGRSNNIHEPNEFLPLAELDLMVKIYKEAIKRLCE